ncbi:MAG: surface protein, partial [Flavipsychrobacter sp.]|nr:surface protein [Flavipsychrobacter sp.]
MKKIFTTNIFTEKKFGFLLVASMFLFSFAAKAAPITWKGGPTQSMSICQNAPAAAIDTFLTASGTTGFTFTWTVTTAPIHGTLSGFPATAASGTSITPTGTSYTPTIGYSGPDTYTIQVSDGTTTVTTTVNVTINATPVISGTPSVCVGATTVLTSGSGGAWSSSNTAIATTPSAFGFVKGIAPGTSIISYTNTSGCVGVQIVTVKVMPSVITGASSVCIGSTTYLSDLVAGGAWSSPDATVSLVSNAVTGVSAGTATISYNVSGCVVTGNINVLTVPNPIVGPTGVCKGNTVALTDFSTGGVWSSSNTTIGSVDGLGNVSGLLTGTVTISYTTGGICSEITVITVDPPLPAVIGAGRVCVGGTITLSNPTTGGTWSTIGGDVTVDINTGDVVGVTAGSATITYAVSSGCLALKAVTVNPNPASISLVSPVMCYSDKTNYATDLTPGGTWTSALVTVSTGGFITAYSVGSGMLSYTLPTGCYNTTPITVNALPGVISGPNKICTGNLYALGDTTLGGTWSTTDIAVLVDIYSGALYGANAGTAIVTYLLPTGCYLLDTITVFDSPTPILGSPNVCVGGFTKLSDAILGGTWDISAGGNATIVPSSGVVTGVLAGAATVTYTTGTGCSITVPLTVWPLPDAYIVTGGGDFCIGGPGVAVGLSGSVSGVRYYLYNGIVLVDSLNGTGLPLNFGLRSSGGFYTVSAKNLTTVCENNMTG